MQTKEYGHDIISFPKILISSEKELFGIVGNYERGKALSEIESSTNIDYLTYILEKLEIGIEDISQKGWNLEDLHEDNILVNEKSYSNPIIIIDTDYHMFQKENDKLQLYKINLKRVFNAINISILLC